MFEAPFWDTDLDLFGFVLCMITLEISRVMNIDRYCSDSLPGEAFLMWSFYNSTKKPTLIALCSGNSAKVQLHHYLSAWAQAMASRLSRCGQMMSWWNMLWAR